MSREGELRMELLIRQEFRSLIPPLEPDEYSELEQSLIKHGNLTPITIWKGKEVILDGHNRYDLCHKHNISLKPPIELPLPDQDSAMIWIIDNQLVRRNLSKYARVLLVDKREGIRLTQKAKANLITSTGGRNPQPLPNSAKAGIDTQEEIAKLAGVSHDTVYKVKQIEAKASPEQKEKLIKGEATINQVYVAIHREEVRQSVKETKWPTGKYRVFYADPPWQYDNHNPPYHFKEQADHYPTMPLSEITALPVGKLAHEDAVLFIWTTSPILEDVFKVINAWGFKYKASFIWDKVKHNMGHYNSVRHEFLLVATRGSCQPENLKLFDSVQVIDRTDHSTKPEAFREIIDTLYPSGPRIELFAREKAEGWEQYGNQL